MHVVKLTFEVHNDGIDLDTEEAIKEAISHPGFYQVLKFERKPEEKKVKRVFHLAELPVFQAKFIRELCTKGYCYSYQVQIAGLKTLRASLTKDLVDILHESFLSIGLTIPNVAGKPPVRPGKDLIRRFRSTFTAYKTATEDKLHLVRLLRDQVKQSSFAPSGVGYDIVCGHCHKQFIACSSEDAKGLVCDECGNQIGVDFFNYRLNMKLATGES